MEQRPYGFAVTLDLDMAAAEEKVRAALKVEGFGVLTEIDVAATLKEKLDLDRPPYKILGACNPNFASKALEVDLELGLFMPCNVVLHPDGDRTTVLAMDPGVMSQMSDDPSLGPIADGAREALKRAMASLEG